MSQELIILMAYTQDEMDQLIGDQYQIINQYEFSNISTDSKSSIWGSIGSSGSGFIAIATIKSPYF